MSDMILGLGVTEKPFREEIQPKVPANVGELTYRLPEVTSLKVGKTLGWCWDRGAGSRRNQHLNRIRSWVIHEGTFAKAATSRAVDTPMVFATIIRDGLRGLLRSPEIPSSSASGETLDGEPRTVQNSKECRITIEHSSGEAECRITIEHSAMGMEDGVKGR
ncbi:hypothetical protein K474DRAFT_1677026 [Panus rudis PR-1116 ss-1]|nr:hypothetical protein K474DRAFT_1677026 [Panus rudis PR-1116 ss-1]